MEIKVIETSLFKLRSAVPSAVVSLIESKVGENFWQFEIKDRIVSGSGAAVSPQIAFNKALSEFVERHAVKYYSSILGTKNSSGFAAHIDAQSAHNASIGELIERDAFLVCWFSNISPSWIQLEKMNFEPRIMKIISYLNLQGINLKLGFLAKSGSYWVSAGIIDFTKSLNNQAGCGFTTEADTSASGALEKAALSLLRIANLVFTRKAIGADLFENTDPSEIKSPYQHLEYYLNPENILPLKDWWDSSSTHILELEPSTIESQILSYPISDSLNRKISHSRSANMLNYFAGTRADFDSIRKRLSDLGLEVKQNLKTPHPLP